MSKSFNCHCEERKKPIKSRGWFVIDRHCNYSAFNGYRRTVSDYSTIVCKNCRAIGRTKAGYVESLKNIPKDKNGVWEI